MIGGENTQAWRKLAPQTSTVSWGAAPHEPVSAADKVLSYRYSAVSSVSYASNMIFAVFPTSIQAVAP